MAIKPTWRGRNGDGVDVSSMTAVARRRVEELTPYAKTLTIDVQTARDKVQRLEADAVETQQQLAYWTTMLRLAIELDRRIEAGEEVADVDSTEVGRPVE